MIERISAILGKEKRLAVGLMSGTSLDGIDAALVEIKGADAQTEVRLLEFSSIPYTAEERERLIQLCSPETSTVDRICEMNVEIGERFAEAALSVIQKAGVEPDAIDFICSHGQTIYHMPEKEATLQIGELAVISARTGIVTIGDFRPNDMAHHGQGAPLVPFVDQLLFSDENTNRVLINIGGISNLTIVPKKRAQYGEYTAFDIGPGNVLIDGVVRTLTNGKESYDHGGTTAMSGKVNPAFLEELLQKDPFLDASPPKSTGRELYNDQLLKSIIHRASELVLSLEDLVATVTQYTVTSIVKSIDDHVSTKLAVDEVLVSGGGVHNTFLMDGLKQGLECPVMKFDEIAFSSDAKEAVAFVVLGNQFLHGRPNNFPSATGARREAVMGKLVFP